MIEEKFRTNNFLKIAEKYQKKLEEIVEEFNEASM